MIKGVNKRIIEINRPQSIYFERAVFYLKPNVSQLPQNIAESEAKRFISFMQLDTYSHNKMSTKHIAIIIAAISLAIGIICLILLAF